MLDRVGVSIQAEVSKKSFLANRSPHTTAEEEARTFARLSDYGDGAIFAGRFAGTSSWERHPNGDEIVQVITGRVELTVLEGDDATTTLLEQGMLSVVARGQWHQLHAPATGVTLMTVTPLPTEVSVQDPRTPAAHPQGT